MGSSAGLGLREVCPTSTVFHSVMTEEIRFAAAQVPVEGLAFDKTLSHSWLAKSLADAGVSPAGDAAEGNVKGRLSRSGRDIVVRGAVVVNVEVPCVRCLRAAQIAVSADLSLLLQPVARTDGRGRRHDDDGEAYEFSASEADVDTYDGDTVALDGFVREAILLEVPGFPLCEDDCPGIPSNAGLAEPPPEIDPRLAPLSAFGNKNGPTTLQDLVDAASTRGEFMGRKPILRSDASGKAKKGKKSK